MVVSAPRERLNIAYASLSSAVYCYVFKTRGLVLAIILGRTNLEVSDRAQNLLLQKPIQKFASRPLLAFKHYIF